MPTSQSDSERHTAASASGRIEASSRSCSKPSRMAAGRHGLQPEPLDRLLGLRVLDDVAEDQLALAAGVAGVDQRVHVLALDQLEQQLEPRLALLDRPQVEVRRNDRQMGKRPLAALDLELVRHAQLQQMADRRRKHVLVALVVVVLLLEAAQRLGDVAGDGRFLGND